MSGRHRTSRPHEMRRSRDGPYPRPVPRGGGGGGPIPVHAIEEEVAMRRDEFRRIRAENLHILEDIDRLKRENSIVEHECRRLSESVPQLRAEKELEAREWIQKVLKLEAEMRSLEKVKPEVRHLRADLQRAESSKEEMAAKIKDLTGELKHLQSENDRIDDIKADIGAQRQEIDRARMALEYEKKAGAELVDHVQVMQRTLVGMAREAEQLRAELARRSSGPDYGPYGPPRVEMGFPEMFGMNYGPDGGYGTRHRPSPHNPPGRLP
ncbi:FLX-like protein [Rhynchospora pubera]|uniref:FLX-like protein n=1 Tax=Rhynchospora pubera TaxID=906938 RepID=A0AAV8H9Z9_9POAL|nr:FLX-like protein [Rhynchospora pubera]